MYFSTLALATTLVASAFSTIAAEPIKAIANLASPQGTVKGYVYFSQENAHSPTWIYANITGLTAGEHGIHIHQYGDLSNGCASFGPHYNPHNVTHGGPESEVRHPGDFGNIVAPADGGYATLNLDSKSVPLSGHHSVLGRGIVVHAGADDLGLGDSPLSNTTGNSGDRVACGIIGYASF